MSKFKLAILALAMTAVSMPALAEDTMVKKGDATIVMPDGKMVTLPMDKEMMATMMKEGKPMEHCMVMAMGDEGKMVMMPDMKMSSCESMMKK